MSEKINMPYIFLGFCAKISKKLYYSEIVNSKFNTLNTILGVLKISLKSATRTLHNHLHIFLNG
jgi:hypothetical protein